MFVRWKRRPMTRTRLRYERIPDDERTPDGPPYRAVRRSEPTGKWAKSAVLVESVRTAAGPRHRHICYLGSIWEGCEGRHWHRAHFWGTADANLDGAGIAGDD